MIVASDILEEPLVRKLRDITYRIVEDNGNRRGVHKIDVVTHDLDHARQHSARVRDIDGVKNIGMWYPISYYKNGQRVRGSVVWLKRDRDFNEMITTLAHEFAHGSSQGSHGYTWRRMNALILPFASKLFGAGINTEEAVWKTVDRYATRYAHTSWDFYESHSKKEAETHKHMKASNACWAKFSSLVNE